MAYEILAYYYDELMEDMPYQKWVDLVSTHVKGKNVFDIACGSGTITLALAKLGYKVDASDLSEEMLYVARQKASINHEPIHFFQANMVEYIGEEKYDGITILVDSLCYVIELEDIKKVFSNVFHMLNDEGTFIFDVHSLFKINDIFNGYEESYDMGDFEYSWKSTLVEQDTIMHEFEFTIDDEVYKEQHIQKSYPIHIYQQLLKTVGFSNIQVIEEEDRNYFICKKGN